ncbi:hypothetical protein O0235_02695 [Tepidiforma flava]|uniref:Uncharacterized protein n=1 Tax=Tepidiforma flava TaxID=3004094 RepID=A0ABY7M9X6_9CHLR|nr:hypothetical protein [Tepidiforma flava]WBL36491.1 hypothetical protein O0235_02695 [Tepidiforma flava]
MDRHEVVEGEPKTWLRMALMTPPWQTTATRMPMDSSMMRSMARKTRVRKASTSSQKG